MKNTSPQVFCVTQVHYKVSLNKKTGILTRLFKENLGDLPKVKRIMTETGDIKQITLIVYCAHSKCKASEVSLSYCILVDFTMLWSILGVLKNGFPMNLYLKMRMKQNKVRTR